MDKIQCCLDNFINNRIVNYRDQGLMNSKKKQIKTKPKKKQSVTQRHNSYKTATNTTKERTLLTIEESDSHQKMVPIKSRLKSHTQSCLQRMQLNQLSPFSSPDEFSLSPRLQQFNLAQQKKTPKDLPKPKPKNKHENSIAKKLELTRRKSKEEQNQQAFQRQFLDLMAHRPITEMSEENEGTTRKPPTIHSDLRLRRANRVYGNKGKIRLMINKIEENYRKIYIQLAPSELKILCAVTVIQRLWRQRKVKRFIGEYISPSLAHSFLSPQSAKDALDSSKSLRLHVTPENQRNGRESIGDTEFQISPISQPQEIASITELSEIQLKEANSSESSKAFCPRLKQYEEKRIRAEIFNPIYEDEKLQKIGRSNEKLRNIVQCFREVKLAPKHKRQNIFNHNSLSEKCLMQALYNKISSHTKGETYFDLFNLKQHQKSKQIKASYATPQKDLTHLDNLIQQLPPKQFSVSEPLSPSSNSAVASQSVKRKEFTTPPRSKPQCSPASAGKIEEKSIKCVGIIADEVIAVLIDDFTQQFIGFTSRKCLQKKKRSDHKAGKKLPGIKYDLPRTKKYLEHLSSYLLQHHSWDIINAMQIFTPHDFLKIYRIELEEELFGEFEGVEQESNWSVIDNTIFFNHQTLFQQEYFHVAEEESKYQNFLLGLLKIQNKCLIDALSQNLQKSRIQRVYYPWDRKHAHYFPNDANPFPPKPIADLYHLGLHLESILEDIYGSVGLQLGLLSRKNEENEEVRLLSSIKQDYDSEGKEWSTQDEQLQIRLEWSEQIFYSFIEEVASQLMKLVTS